MVQGKGHHCKAGRWRRAAKPSLPQSEPRNWIRHQLRRPEGSRRRENSDEFEPSRPFERHIVSLECRTSGADIFTIDDRRSFANLSPRIRILIQLTNPTRRNLAGWSGRATVVRNFLVHWLRLLRGSVQ